MKKLNFRFIVTFLGTFLLFFACGKNTKIAFIVKDASEPWFQNEFAFADKAAKDLGFTLYKYPLNWNKNTGYTTENVLEDLERARSNGVGGVIICPPDVYAGDKIIAFCKKNKMNLMTVDDRFKDPKSWSGFREDIPHLGIDGYRIGRLVGINLAQALLDRDWKSSEVGVFMLKDSKNPDLVKRINGAMLMLQEVLPFKSNNFINIEISDLNVVSKSSVKKLIQNEYSGIQSEFRKWIVLSYNDDLVIWGVQALNDLALNSQSILAIGINGTEEAENEIRKDNGFFGTIKLSSDIHGYDTCKIMYNWIVKEETPDNLVFTSGTLIKKSNLATN